MHFGNRLRRAGIFALLLVSALSLLGSPTQSMLPRGSLTVASPERLNSLNPLSEDPQAITLMPLFLATLLEINPQSGRIEPALAERWEASPDRTELTLTLRAANFSDGTPFTTDDVLFTFNEVLLNARLRTETLDLLRQFLQIGGEPLINAVEGVDERTVRFMLRSPLPTSFLILLAQIPILPKHKLEGKDIARVWGVGTKPEEIAGLGPFKVVEFIRDKVVLNRNDFYWKLDDQGVPLPRLDQVIWLGNQREILQQFRDGKIDLFEPNEEEALSLPAAARLILGGPRTSFITLFINQDVTDPGKQALFRDPRFRQALAYATDRAAFTAQSLGGLAVPRESPLHPLSPYYDEASLVRYPFDLAQAAELLDQLGLKDADGDGWRELPGGEGFQLTFLLHREDPVRIAVAEVYQANLSRIGLKVELKITSPSDWRRSLFARPPRYEVAMATYQVEIFEMPSVVLQLAGLFSAGGEYHVYRPSDASAQELTEVQKEIDKILAQLPAASDAQALFARLQQLISEDVPVIPLYSPPYLVAVQPSVENAELINAYGYARFLELLSKE